MSPLRGEKGSSMLVRTVVLVCSALVLVSCGVAAQPPKASPPAPVDAVAPMAPKKVEPEKPKDDSDQLAAQLNKIEALLRSPSFEHADDVWKEKAAAIPALRDITKVADQAINPVHLMEIVAHADNTTRDDGALLYGMLIKNAKRYAGRPWFIMRAKLLEIYEADGKVTSGRLMMDPGKNPLFLHE